MKLPESFDRAMRDLRRAQIPVYAGNAAFFLVLSFLPLLTLLLAALQYTVFRPEDLLALLSRIMPDEVLPLFSDFLQKAYQKSGAAIISLSALTAAWSASRGIYGISKGLSAVLDVLTPANYDEFRRVLSPDGMLVKVYPGQDYLREIRAARGMSAYEEGQVDAYLREKAQLVKSVRVHETLPVSPELWGDFVRMTPLNHDLSAAEKDALAQRADAHVTVDLHVALCRFR